MKRKNRIAVLLAGTTLGITALAVHAQSPGGGMMSGNNMPQMMMRNCAQNDAPCAARMKAHREHMDRMHAIAEKLKVAKTDKERVALLQSYVELMDEQMVQMSNMMDQRRQMMGPRMGPPSSTPGNPQ